MVRQGDSIIIRKRDKNVDQIQVQELVLEKQSEEHPSVLFGSNTMPIQGDFNPMKQEYHSRKRDTHTLAGTSNLYDSGYCLPFDSRGSIFKQILAALQDDNISRVALYGMAGSGKTYLAKQVGQKAKELNLFNLVVSVYVTKEQDVKMIQGEIAYQLGLRFGEEDDNPVARQIQISVRLRNKGPVLIILDDVRQRLDLQQIGILNNDGSRYMGCNYKVLLTSSSREVGQLMGFQLSFHLYLLNDEEAWQLLREVARVDDGSADLIAAAKEVAKYCQGSPFAISVTGSLLRGKNVDQWRQVLESFPISRWSVRGVYYHTLHVVYDALSSKEAKTIFIICGLFPEDYQILIEDVSQYAVVRLGLCSSKDEVNAAINTLKDCRLLTHSETSKYHVRMHIEVRGFAVEVVYDENPTYEDSIREYMDALRQEEDFQWKEELDRLLRQLYGVHEQHPCSSTSNSLTFNGGEEGLELQVMQPYSYMKAVTTIPKPSGKLVDFCGLCRVDKSFLPLLKEACAMRPQLIQSQRRHSEFLRQSAFDCLGRVLFMLHNVRKRDWMYHKDELQMFWEQLKAFKFELGWLLPVVEGVLSSSEIARIEALQEEENYWSQEATRRREHLMIAESRVADIRTEIARAESELNGFAIAQLSHVRLVSKVIPTWKKVFFKK